MKGKVCLSSCREYGAALMMMVVEMVMLGGLGLSLARNQLDQEQHKKIYGPGSILENEASLTSPENCLIATEHLSFPEKDETKSLICVVVVVVGIVVVGGVFKLV